MIRIDGQRVLRDRGGSCIVVESGTVDVTALDPGRRASVVGAFNQLCRTIEQTVQIVVQVRRWPADESPPPPSPDADARLRAIVAPLRQATVGHRRALLDEVPAYRRSVLFVIGCERGGAESNLERAARRVLAALSAAGVGGRILEGQELTARLMEACGRDPDADDGSHLAEVPWSVHWGHAMSGSLLVRGFVMRRLPGVAVEAGWLGPLLQVRAECDITVHLQNVPASHAMSALNRRLRDMRADQLIEIDRDRIGDPHVNAGVEALFELRERLARNQARPLRLSLVGVARARTPAELERSAEALQLGFMTILTGCQPAHLRHLEAAATAWPLGDDRLGMGKLVDSAAASTCIPWVEAVCHDYSGYSLGRSVDGDAPVRLAPFEVDHHVNANVAVFAASGHGKSYALGTIVLEAAAAGIGSVIIDPEGEYERLVGSLGGDYLNLVPGGGTALNVFDVGDGNSSARDRRAEVVGAVVDLVNVLCGGTLGDTERAAVDAAATGAMERAAANARTAVLGDCLEDIASHAPRVATVLRRFTAGPLGDLFNRPTSVEPGAPVVGVGLRDLKTELVPAATLIVAEWLWSLVRREPRRRHLVFDEVGLLCAHAPLRALLVQLARRCRKYDTSLVVATQNASDLLATEEGRVVATNPAIVLLGGHRGAETARMRDAFSLTEDQRRFLERAGRGEFLLLAGQRRLAMRIEVPLLHHELLTRRPLA